MGNCSIRYDKLLYACGKPIRRDGTESEAGLFLYAEEQAAKALSSVMTLQFFSELHADVYDAVFAGKKSIAELTRKRFGRHGTALSFRHLERCVFLSMLARGKIISVCPIEKSPDKAIKLLPPQRVSAELENVCDRRSKKISKKMLRTSRKNFSLAEKHIASSLQPLNMRIVRSSLLAAANDRRFIAHYNEETFFKNIVIGRKALDEADLHFIFSSDNANRIMNLRQKPVRLAWAILYSMAQCGFSLRDVFSVSSVFSGDINSLSRKNEQLRSQKTSELIKLLQYGKDDEILDKVIKMGDVLLETALPPLDLNNTAALAENYTLYAGASNIGAAFIAAASDCRERLKKKYSAESERIFKAAFLLSQYSKAVKLCDALAARDSASQLPFEKTEGYAEALELSKTLGCAEKASDIIK